MILVLSLDNESQRIKLKKKIFLAAVCCLLAVVSLSVKSMAHSFPFFCQLRCSSDTSFVTD